MKAVKIVALVLTALTITACGNGSTSYSLLSEGNAFRQASSQQLTKIDVMWVVDNSGSMASSQTNLANNFPAFNKKFTEKNYDFQMALTTTDAYLALPLYTPYYNTVPTPSYYQGRPQEEIAWFRDGNPTQGPSGYSILTSAITDLHNVFIQNVMQGIAGRGDERSFQSMRTALDSPNNSGFVRQGGFLAVILVTDEDDFSHDGTAQYERYDRPLHTVDSYVSYLDGLTGSSGPGRRYSVNSISVNDQACLDSINNGAQKIGVRVGQLATATGGVKGNLCGDFAQELALISKSIVELSTQFFLNGSPVPESIRVIVNGVEVPKSGWTYIAASNAIQFQYAYTPPQNAIINVTFDPTQLSF